MFKRLLILQLLITGGLSLVFLLPKTPPLQPSAIATMELPNVLVLSGWAAGPKIEPSKKELEALSKDTEFSRRNYYRTAPLDRPPGSREMLQASIVLSGKDLNNSVHRPERCLPAQGLSLISSSDVPVKLRDGRTITLKRLKCEGKDETGRNAYTHLNYYWFVGHDSIKYSHYGRTFQDMRDRLMEGYDQRWAYITVSSNLVNARMTDELGQEYLSTQLTEEETDRNVTEFVSELAPEIINFKSIQSIE